jgi:X-Pro dipeptidyl-peptidase
VTIASGAGRLTAGWRRLGLDGDGSLQPLRAGADLVVGWDLAPLDRVVPAGRRLGLVLFAARPLPDAVLPGEPAPAVVDLRAVTVTLPVVGGQAALDAALG